MGDDLQKGLAMSMTLGWGDILLRLGLAAAAGTVIGINRGQHGRAAGLRTMLLVCTGAALAMVVANWFLIVEGGPVGEAAANPARFVQGILAGMGFLGAGAILRKGNMVRGVTTAATLWFVTILGICFGLGYWSVGLVAWGIALFALFVLPWAEMHIHADRYGTVTVITRADGLDADELHRRLQALGVRVEGFCIHYNVAERLKTIRCDVEYQVNRTFDLPQQVVADLAHRSGVIEVKWK